MTTATMPAPVNTATCSVLLSLENDTVTVTSPKGGSITVGLPSLRKTSRTLYEKLVTDDSIIDEESVDVVLTFAEMRTVKELSATKEESAPAPAPIVEEEEKVEEVTAPVVVSDTPKHDSGDQVKDTVERMEVSGVFGRAVASNANEQRVRSIQKVLAKIKDQPLYVVNYYIPVELSTSQYATVTDPETGVVETVQVEGVRIPSPAKDFYKHGIRLDGSNWFMTEDELNSKQVQHYFSLFREYADFRGVNGKGSRGWAVKQSAEESAKLVEWAMEELRCHLIQLHTSLIQNIATAQDNFEATEKKWQEVLALGGEVSDKTTTEGWAKRNNRVRSELKKAAESLHDAVRLAERYDATECVEDLFQALRLAIRSNVGEFNALAERLGVRSCNVRI